MQTTGNTNAVCFSGHRPKQLCGYNESQYITACAQLRDLVFLLAQRNVRDFITGGAQGIDQLAFWAVQQAKTNAALSGHPIRNILVLPFPGFGSNWAAEGAFSKAQLDMAIRSADEVRYASETAPKNKQDAVRLLMARNEVMLSQSKTLVAVCNLTDWRDETVKSGTAAAMRSALKSHMRIMRVPYNTTNDGLYLDIPNAVIEA